MWFAAKRKQKNSLAKIAKIAKEDKVGRRIRSTSIPNSAFPTLAILAILARGFRLSLPAAATS
jgi:hypothetical protein